MVTDVQPMIFQCHFQSSQDACKGWRYEAPGAAASCPCQEAHDALRLPQRAAPEQCPGALWQMVLGFVWSPKVAAQRIWAIQTYLSYSILFGIVHRLFWKTFLFHPFPPSTSSTILRCMQDCFYLVCSLAWFRPEKIMLSAYRKKRKNMKKKKQSDQSVLVGSELYRRISFVILSWFSSPGMSWVWRQIPKIFFFFFSDGQASSMSSTKRT